MHMRLLSLLAVMAAGWLSQSALAQKTVSVTIQTDSEAPGHEGHRAMDGNPRTMWHTAFGGSEPVHPHQIIVDLGAPFEISGFTYRARPGRGNGTVKDYECFVSKTEKALGQAVVKGRLEGPHIEHRVEFPDPVKGRYVCFRALSEVNGRAWTSIAELQLISTGVRFVAKNATGLPLVHEDGTPLTEIEAQYNSLGLDLRKRAYQRKIADEIHRSEASILDTDRDPLDIVLRRTKALLADVRQLAGAPDLQAQRKALTNLQATAEKTMVEEWEARFKIYAEVCRIRRKIALSNPLLDFDEILFIKHHRSIFNHMCDQYYGMAAAPGGGLYVLQGAFSDQPTVRDVLANAVVENGRLAGKKLDGGPKRPPAISFDGEGNVRGPEAKGGSFLSPDLSFGGKEIVFAYVECSGDPKHRHHTDASRGHWAEGRCYHVFRVNADGSSLRQLTDGTWNDFDPCFLPNDRIAFISERRGGYLRCGRVCPTYTLYDMAANGSDITCLSFHETNEWHPSVTNDGRIIWTRWDYVDRYGCIAHMPWVTSIDGRDPRAVHGNFSPRKARPDMELDCRAIPNSAKFIGTAAPHHGQSYGSLILIDPDVVDDDAMAPVKRITPEVRFPESQGGAQVYGTPWPLSEDYYLCVYDSSMRPGAGSQGRGFQPGNYGIYLVDAFGNKELIYRDPEIACLSPIPLKPRTRPPVAPNIARGGPETDPAARASLPPDEKPREGTLAVVDVYDSLFRWPEGTEIKAIRVLQVLPMSVPSGRLRPHETGVRVASAGDSVVPVRWVLGTAPVEADGSAHFTVPANRELFFQALDKDGLAVQSMRSATHVREGERLVCAGCHEPKNRATPPFEEVTRLAMRRPPSRLTPDVDGSKPFSYPRLVQPVLDRHCVDCHATHEKKPMSLTAKPIKNNWFASYNNLVKKYGFHNYGNGLRTTPGQFGARASKLYKILKAGHYGVKLSKEEMHRITLWLDCTSMFYGVYEREPGKAQLRGEIAEPTLR